MPFSKDRRFVILPCRVRHSVNDTAVLKYRVFEIQTVRCFSALCRINAIKQTVVSKAFNIYGRKKPGKISTFFTKNIFLCGFQCLGLFNIQAGHQPVELLPGDGFYFGPVPWPTVSSLHHIQTLVKHYISVRFP